MGIPILLFVLALAVRLGLIATFPHAAYPDAYYYVDVARSLAHGTGFSVDFLWSFVDVGGKIPANPVLPIPSNAHWMPLASLIQVPFILLFNDASWAPMIPFALIGSLAAPLTYFIARDAGASPTVQKAAGLLVAVPAAATVFLGQPDNFSLYQVLGATALWLGARGLRGDSRSFALAGLIVGLAALARNDGVLLGATLAIIFAWDRVRSWRSHGTRAPKIPFAAAVACVLLFVVMVAPWYARQLATFGTISPSSTSGKILWIRDIQEMNSIDSPGTLSWFLSQGPVSLAWSRVLGLAAAIGNYGLIACSFFLLPLGIVGAWLRRRDTAFAPFFIYAALLFGFAGLLFAPHVPYGMFLHSALSLVPHTFILAIEAVVALVAWVAARRSTWDRAQATRTFVAATVGVGVVTAILGTWKVHAEWTRDQTLREGAAAALDARGIPTSDLLMTADSAGFRLITGHPGIVTPSDTLDTIRKAAAAYKVRWLILERTKLVGDLRKLAAGSVTADWVGQPVWSMAWPNEGDTPNDLSSYPGIVLYPLCTTEADTRCSATAQAPTGAQTTGAATP